MALTNRDRVEKALDLLRIGLISYVQREMEAEYKQQWLKQAAYSLKGDFDESDPHFDAHALLVLMWDQWNSVFGRTLGHAERSLVSELRTIRNDWAHQKPFSTDDAYRALDSIGRLLTAISAPEAREVERQKQELLRLKFEEQARNEQRKAAVAPLEGRPTAGLRAWRELVTPHPDVASGRYQQAEFAADLAAVHANDSTAGAEYRDPEEFYRRTFLTQGLRDLLINALRRVCGGGGDPVVELKTNFGGGKTHSMLALYHLLSGIAATKLAGIESILSEIGQNTIPVTKRAVLVGTALSPGQAHTKPDGITVHTLWGEMAWQLGNQAGYALLAETDQRGVSPGSDLLRQLLNRYSPCLILIDEWVAFVRQLYRKSDLPAGSFDTNLTFAQALTEAVKQVPGALLVASLPASQIEIGGEGGQEALVRLQNTFGRIEATWRPASAEESFEIVRRRLFQPVTEPRVFAARDAIIASYARMYQEQPQDFPNNTREAGYQDRMKAAYPIHPELFDRLYNDWSSLERFQRTRGVLRLMAAVIHALWERNDSSLLIMPASIPMDNADVQKELTRYLEDHWTPIIERDVDGPVSLPLAQDRENPNLGRYSACRRVARTIFMGSAPTSRSQNPGVDERYIKLGAVQPGENTPAFGDALRRLTDNATHLYVDRSRYWYSTQPSVSRLAQERAAELDQADVWTELTRRLRAERQRGEFSAVHAVPNSSADVPDEAVARLVVLGPEHEHVRKGTISRAQQEAQIILKNRGNSPRLYQNMLVFVAADATRLPELESALRQYLAWKSIVDNAVTLNLDAFQHNQAQTKFKAANETIDLRILETYIWLLAPYQSNSQDPSTLQLEEARLQGQDALALQAGRKLIASEGLFNNLGGVRLRMTIDQHNLWNQVDHLPLKQLWEYLARYPYLPRLSRNDVLARAVEDGISQTTWRELFAYAASFDGGSQRYIGLCAGEKAKVIIDSQSVLLRPEVALRQIEAEQHAQMDLIQSKAAPYIPPEEGSLTKVSNGVREGGTVSHSATQTPTKTVAKQECFYATVEVSPLRMGSEASKIAEHVVQHLAGIANTTVKVTISIDATIPDGVSEAVRRTILENANVLKFKLAEFEDVSS